MSGSPGLPDPTSTPTYATRRSSYASVVSGTASTLAQAYNQPVGSGAVSHLVNQTSYSSNYTAENDLGYGSPTAPPRYDLRNYRIGHNANSNGVNAQSGSWGSGRLPSFSGTFGSWMNGHTHDYANPSRGTADHFFVPSYLRGSKYIQKLEQSLETKAAAHHQEGNGTAGALSTSGSSANLHGKASSHRGVRYEIAENTPSEPESVSLLPTKWNVHDKHAGIEVLSDGQELKFVGGKAVADRDHEASAIRADHHMPQQCGIYYYEISISHRKREEHSIGIGFSSKKVPLSRLPGWEPESWAYHGDDGNSFCCQSSGKQYGSPFGPGDTVGCGVNFRTGSAFFTKNGVNLGTAFREIKGELFPSVGMKKPGEYIRVNFGQSPFVFDIDGMMALEREQVRRQIVAMSTMDLVPGLNETELVQALTLQYLTYEGYIETAKSFADEVYAEKVALNLDPNETTPKPVVKEDDDAGHRQRIRTAILDGDVDRALKLTNVHYPQVLKDNEHVYFRLRCRKFIEMIRQGAEMQQRTNAANGTLKSNGHKRDWYDDVINNNMDIDEHQVHNSFDKMDEDPTENQIEYDKLLQDTLVYGQDLQGEFKDDPRREVSKALEDAFALMAYQDPLNAKEVSHLLDPSGRVAVAEELNSGILLSLGKSSTTALEKLIQQTTILLEDLRETGGPGAFVNIDDYLKPIRNLYK